MDSSKSSFAFPSNKHVFLETSTANQHNIYENNNTTSTTINNNSSDFFTINNTNISTNVDIDTNTNTNATSTINPNHKRGTQNSLFNSDTTLVNDYSSHSRMPSFNSETSTISNSTNYDKLNGLNELNKHTDVVASSIFVLGPNPNSNSNIHTNRSTISSSASSPFSTSTGSPSSENFISASLSSNAGLLNRPKFHGLGHRTTKSENFAQKLLKKPDKKSINQLNNLQEEEDIPTTVTNNNSNNDANDTSNNLSSNYFDPLPSAPIDSKHNFSFINNSTNASPLNNTTINTPSPISTMFSPKSADFNFSHGRKSTLLLSNGTNDSNIPLPPSRSSFKIKSNKLKLPSHVKLLHLSDAENLIRNWSNSIGSDNLSNLLIIDVRPFHDYCKSHMTNSINICLPSTLLKRSTFSLEKCIQTLSNKEKSLFNQYFKREKSDFPRILFYDDYLSTVDNISSSIFYLAGKFIQNLNWNSSLYILENGFSKFNDHLSLKLRPPNAPDLMMSLDHDLSSTSINSETFSPLAIASPNSLISPGNLFTKQKSSGVIPCQSNSSKSPLGLSRFILPDNSNMPIFKTRNYDEVLSNKPDLSIHLLTDLSNNEISTLPQWLVDIIGNDMGSTKLTEKFNQLQIEERTRLNNALNKNNTNTNITNKNDNVVQNDNYNVKDKDSVNVIANGIENTNDYFPVISSGVELGRKNRYKDIFLYEHARVRLNNDTVNVNDPNDYINASYISYPKSKLNYIATQGPLKETIGDFWKMVYDNNVPIIFSLTAQSENQVEKCAPFWESGTFYSNNLKIEIELIEFLDNLKLSYKTSAECVIRRIMIKIDNKPVRQILQVHMLSWPDFGIVICEEDILSLIGMKRYICSTLNITENPVLVHCSAGCGRTGSFCVIDTSIDILLNNNSVALSNDVIYDVTSVFRSQRIFMVQTLRQYILIYDSIIKFIKMRYNSNHNIAENDVLNDQGLIDWKLKDLGILQRFINSYT